MVTPRQAITSELPAASTRRVSMRDIARVLEINPSTVSRALNNDRNILPATRERVRAAAEKMGYRPDPMLSALMEYRTNRQRRSYQANLAWITSHPTRDGWNHSAGAAFYKGACARAGQLGYKIEEFWLREPGMDQQRAIQILSARNIQGLIFLPKPRAHVHLRMAWNQFPAVTFGRTLVRPLFHHISHDHYRSFTWMMRHLKRLGYRRPGLVSYPQADEAIDRLLQATFCSYQVLAPHKQIPLFAHRPARFGEFKAWLLRHRPDVVISPHEMILEWIVEVGFKVPDEMGFVLSAKQADQSEEMAGMTENSELIGDVAIQILVQMINRGERGALREPMSTIIEGKWTSGKTLRASAWEKFDQLEAASHFGCEESCRQWAV